MILFLIQIETFHRVTKDKRNRVRGVPEEFQKHYLWNPRKNLLVKSKRSCLGIPWSFQKVLPKKNDLRNSRRNSCRNLRRNLWRKLNWKSHRNSRRILIGTPGGFEELCENPSRNCFGNAKRFSGWISDKNPWGVSKKAKNPTILARGYSGASLEESKNETLEESQNELV